MTSDVPLLERIVQALQKGEDLDRILTQLEPNDRSRLMDLIQLEQSLAELNPADDDVAPELIGKLRSALKKGQSSAKEQAFSPGNSFGAYQIVRELGRGGMGTVYEAVQIHLGKRVAVKVIAPHILSDPNAVARFRREMKAAGSVEHGNVVRAMDAGEIKGTLYLVTEYVSGINLGKIVAEKGPFDVQRALQIVLQACRALQAAHASGITHRDVKPSNLILTSDGQVKLLDLGLARVATERQTDVTTTGAIFGTPDYMAPEQWDDPKSVDGRADLYSLGCTLYFLLTGKPPFAGEKYPTNFSKMRAHMEAPCPVVPTGDGVDGSQVNKLLQKLLAKKPDQRFASATELIEAISPLIIVGEKQPNPLSSILDPIDELVDNQHPSGIAKDATTIREQLSPVPASHDAIRGSAAVNKIPWLVIFGSAILGITSLVYVASKIIAKPAIRSAAELEASNSKTLDGQPIETQPGKDQNFYNPVTMAQLHRTLAQRVLECSGIVQVVSKLKTTVANDVNQLPSDTFAIDSIILHDAPKWTLDDHLLLQRIQYIPSLNYGPSICESTLIEPSLSVSCSSMAIAESLTSSMNFSDSSIVHLTLLQKGKWQPVPDNLLQLPALRTLTASLSPKHLEQIPPDSPIQRLDLTSSSLSMESIEKLSNLKYLSEVIVRGELSEGLIRKLAELPNLRLLSVGSVKIDLQALASELHSSRPNLTFIAPKLDSSAAEQQALQALSDAGVGLSFADASNTGLANKSHFAQDVQFRTDHEPLATEFLPLVGYAQGLGITANREETLKAVFAHDEIWSLRLNAADWTGVYKQIPKLKNLGSLYCIGPTSEIDQDIFREMIQNCPLSVFAPNLVLDAVNLADLAKYSTLNHIRFLVKASDYQAIGVLAQIPTLRIVEVTAVDELNEDLRIGLSKLKQIRVLRIQGGRGDAAKWLDQLHRQLPDCTILTEQETILPQLLPLASRKSTAVPIRN